MVMYTSCCKFLGNTIVWYKCWSDATMVTWSHNSTIWSHNSSAMTTINRKYRWLPFLLLSSSGYSIWGLMIVLNNVSMLLDIWFIIVIMSCWLQVYRCLSCDYLFGNLSDMKRHLKIRHHLQVEDIHMLENVDGNQVTQLVSSAPTTIAELPQSQVQVGTMWSITFQTETVVTQLL